MKDLRSLKSLLADPYLSFRYRMEKANSRQIGNVNFLYPISESSHIESNFHSEERIIEAFLETVDQDSVFYDIGADRGIYSCLAGRKYPSLEVIAFEPHPITSVRLEKIFHLNSLHGRVIRKALGNRSGRVGMSGYRIDPGGTPSVSLLTGDEVVDSGLPEPTVMKIDVEGMELDVLQGFRKTLASGTCEAVFVEVHPTSLFEGDLGLQEAEIEQLLDLLNEHGYSVQDLTSLARSSGNRSVRGQRFLKATL